MHDFLLKTISENNIEQELKNIGYDNSYIFSAKNKFNYKNFKIFNLNCAQANILKQLALSVGADCGTNKNVITGKIDKSDCILGGSSSQLYKISEKLRMQPFGLKYLGILIEKQITSESGNKTQIMGILNVTKDSFSDGGQYYKTEDAIIKLNKLIAEGADIIDIGAESTKPGAKEICAQSQLESILPILKYINDNNINVPISIDTRNSEVAQACINMGATIINDVSGLDFDDKMISVIAKNTNTKIIIQHSKGIPEEMQSLTNYENLIDDIYLSLYNKVKKSLDAGINLGNIIIDPGIGFGKTREQNFEIIKRWSEFKTIGCPILIGVSRKSLLNMPDETNEVKDIYSLALNSVLINDGVDYIRVHNVGLHKNLLKIIK